MNDDDTTNVGMTPNPNGCNEPPPSLDEMAALVRHACEDEAEIANEHNVLRALARRRS